VIYLVLAFLGSFEAMTVSRAFVPFLFLLAFASAVPADEAVVWKENVRGWTIKVDRSLSNSCFMYAAFDAGGVLRAQFNVQQSNFQLMIGDEDWRSIEHGKIYPIEVEFGNRGAWTGDAVGFEFSEGGWRTLVFSVPLEGDRAFEFIREMQQERFVTVDYENSEIMRLSLSGTFAALEELKVCQVTMLDAQDRNVSNDPFSGGAVSGDDPFQ
jgi:hypothetical protein